MVAGLYDSRSLDKETYKTLLFEACHPKIANCYLQKRLPYPAIDDDAHILEPLLGSETESGDSFVDWVKQNGGTG